jgi:hypothetical protein
LDNVINRCPVYRNIECCIGWWVLTPKCLWTHSAALTMPSSEPGGSLNLSSGDSSSSSWTCCGRRYRWPEGISLIRLPG